VFCPTIADPGCPRSASRRFALYVEGPRDRDILRLFARKLSPKLARTMDPCVRILGGRRPVRAAALFRELAEKLGIDDEVAPRGVCVLDRDDLASRIDLFPEEPRLRYVVWRRRHIESYLLVPAAIRRCLGRPDGDRFIDRFLENHIPDASDERAFEDFDAKRLFARQGPISKTFGRPVRPRDIVRCMAPGDIHPDVRDLMSMVVEDLSDDRDELPTR